MKDEAESSSIGVSRTYSYGYGYSSYKDPCTAHSGVELFPDKHSDPWQELDPLLSRLEHLQRELDQCDLRYLRRRLTRMFDALHPL